MNRLTAILITYNEEHNLPRALASLEDLAEEIVVVDSGSTDRTCEIARRHGARVFRRAFRDFGDQKNFAASQATQEWILSLDADEELSPDLRASLREWKQREPHAAAYVFARRASYLGGWIRHSGWYPDRKVRLYRRDRARFVGRLHEAVEVDGPAGQLSGELYHYTVRTLDEHARKMEVYTTLAAEELFRAGRRRWRLAMLLAPLWAFVRTFVLERGFLDGYRGWLIARMAARYVFLKYRKLGRRVEGSANKPGPALGKDSP
jgi:glycosyltransferase involved in cell wall biosynthesis